MMMPANPLDRIVQRLYATARRRDVADHSDARLLASFIEQRDDAAFAALMHRHGAMVWNVCRRILPDHHDVEDAFQATFLVLVRKAASIAPKAMVGNWLYGVAYQTALKARSTLAKRRAREKQVAKLPEPVPRDQNASEDWLSVLDQELNCLPAKYRLAIVLCDLEGRTRKQAAKEIGVPEGTVAARLARGRVMLMKRLERHGLALTAGSLVSALTQNAASGCVPAGVTSSTLKAAGLLAAGQAVATGVVSADVAALTKGVLTAMLLTKLKTTVAILFLIAAGLGASMWLHGAQTSEPVRAQGEKTLEKNAVIVNKDQVKPPVNSAKGAQELNNVNEDIIKPGDRLVVRVTGTPPEDPIKGDFQVEAAGTLPLSPTYGRVQVKGMNLVEAEKEIQRHLKKTLKEPEVMVTRDIPYSIDDTARDPAVERRLRRLEEEIKEVRTAVEKLQRNK
jgi:RNA polymerase sigma factor (sigma-70 family)